MTLKFILQTCESLASGEQPLEIAFKAERVGEVFALDDPFGVRDAVLPVFHESKSASLTGYGTCFQLNPWGGLVTASHVIEEVASFTGGEQGFVALRNLGLVFGSPGVPSSAIARFSFYRMAALKDSDPMRVLTGNFRPHPLDVAFVESRPLPVDGEARAGTLPVRVNGGTPSIGSPVIALGFPNIETQIGRIENVANIIQENGLQAALGIVTKHHPRGRDQSNPTPVFEVKAKWPSGMSGGPVLNLAGEVVGVVSRSYLGDGDGVGVGWASCLEWLPRLDQDAPTLDPLNPTSRIGWGYVAEDGELVSQVVGSEVDAVSMDRPPGATLRKVTTRIGTSDYIVVGSI